MLILIKSLTRTKLYHVHGNYNNKYSNYDNDNSYSDNYYLEN